MLDWLCCSSVAALLQLCCSTGERSGGGGQELACELCGFSYMCRQPELKQVLAYHYLNHMNVRENLEKKIQEKKLEEKKEKRE